MTVSSRYILQQGPVLATLAQGAWGAVRAQLGVDEPQRKAHGSPTDEIVVTLPPRPRDLIKTYVRHVGGDPASYRKTVPAHLWPQWGFPLIGRTIRDLGYPLIRVLNGGCRLEMNAPLPQGEPLIARVRLEEIDENERRVVLKPRITTGSEDIADALVAKMYVIVPLAGTRSKNGASGRSSRPQQPTERVPADAEEVARWRLRPDIGLDFAKLTGDFNPVHWVRPYAKALGFRNTINHGFSTMARAMESLQRNLFAGSTRSLRVFDVKLTRPLVLPARVGVYVQGNRILVGDAPGGPAYLVGTFEKAVAGVSA